MPKIHTFGSRNPMKRKANFGAFKGVGKVLNTGAVALSERAAKPEVGLLMLPTLKRTNKLQTFVDDNRDAEDCSKKDENFKIEDHDTEDTSDEEGPRKKRRKSAAATLESRWGQRQGLPRKNAVFWAAKKRKSAAKGNTRVRANATVDYNAPATCQKGVILLKRNRINHRLPLPTTRSRQASAKASLERPGSRMKTVQVALEAESWSRRKNNDSSGVKTKSLKAQRLRTEVHNFEPSGRDSSCGVLWTSSVPVEP